jgi:hypothetical protein
LSAVRASGFAFNVEMNCLSYRAGFQIAEVPITFPDRTVGRSKLTRSIVAEAALLVWRMRRIAVPGLPRPSFAPLPLPRIDSPLASA